MNELSGAPPKRTTPAGSPKTKLPMDENNNEIRQLLNCDQKAEVDQCKRNFTLTTVGPNDDTIVLSDEDDDMNGSRGVAEGNSAPSPIPQPKATIA